MRGKSFTSDVSIKVRVVFFYVLYSTLTHLHILKRVRSLLSFLTIYDFCGLILGPSLVPYLLWSHTWSFVL